MPAAAYNPAYGTNYKDLYANVVDESLNVSGASQPISQIVVVAPGFGYTTAPAVSLYGGGGTGATAVASLNGVTGITLVTSGSGYTSTPTVTITGGGGTGATAAATVSGGVVTTITVINPGSNYTTTPTVAITGGGGTGATAQATITLGSVGSITLTNPGSGYTKAPYVYLTGGGGTGATADAVLNNSLVLTGKNLVEGMDMEFGRMNAVLGSTPSALAPTVGAGPVVGAAYYVDPPTEILTPDQTLLWRIMHVGVDSHALHFHLFNVQVVNRVDWTNTIKPPYENELGWKETIRTNPFEDIIVALRPVASTMKLPFGVPDSNRPLDVTAPLGSTAGFSPVAPPPGLPQVAQLTNVMTNFGWEYVWHCHLLGHEENDMMRPMVMTVSSTVPAVPALTATRTGTPVNLTWTDGTPFNYATWKPTSTLGNPANEIGFRVERATVTGGAIGAYTQIATPLANITQYTDSTGLATTSYSYRVTAYNVAGAAVSIAKTVPGHTVTTTAAANPTTVASGGQTSLTAGATDSFSHAISSWSWSDGGAGGTFSSTTSQNPTYTAAPNMTATNRLVTLTVTATCAGPSPVSGNGSAVLTVQSGLPHTVTVTAAANPRTVRSRGKTSLTATATDSLGHTVFSWQWSDNGAGGTFSSATAQNPTYTAPTNTSILPKIVSLTCTATCKQNQPSVSGNAKLTLSVRH